MASFPLMREKLTLAAFVCKSFIVLMVMVIIILMLMVMSAVLLTMTVMIIVFPVMREKI